MKKLIALVLFVSLTFVLTACGPNSDYYKLKKQTVYYAQNMDLVIDPYTIFEENNDWVKGLSNEKKATFRKDYRVEVEYRLYDAHAKYKNYDFAEDNTSYKIIVEDPKATFDAIKGDSTDAVQYEFKLHFIHENDDDKSDMINYYGIVELVEQDIYPVASTVTINKGTTYSLLSNITVKELPEGKTLTDLYAFDYSISPDANVAGNSATFAYKGTYTVTIVAKEIIQSDSDDGTGDGGSGDGGDDSGGASEPWDGNRGSSDGVITLSNPLVKLTTTETEEEIQYGDEFTIVYTVVVE